MVIESLGSTRSDLFGKEAGHGSYVDDTHVKTNSVARDAQFHSQLSYATKSRSAPSRLRDVASSPKSLKIHIPLGNTFKKTF